MTLHTTSSVRFDIRTNMYTRDNTLAPFALFEKSRYSWEKISKKGTLWEVRKKTKKLRKENIERVRNKVLEISSN